MDLIMLVLVICLVGFVVWALTTYIPLPPGWSRVIHVLALILLVIYLLQRIGRVPNLL